MRTNIALPQKKFVDFCCRTWMQILRLRLQNWQTLNNYKFFMIYIIVGIYTYSLGYFYHWQSTPPRNLLWRIVYESKKLRNYSWWQISDFREIALCTPVDCRNNSLVKSLPNKMLLVTNFKFQQIDCRCILVDGNGRSVNKALWLIVDGWVIGPRCASMDRNAWIYRAGCFLLICPNKNLYADQWYWRAAV